MTKLFIGFAKTAYVHFTIVLNPYDTDEKF